jgi:hypothetical protein
MIRCHQCGTDNLDGSEFCDECGNKLSAVASVRSVPAQKPPVPPPPQFAPPPPPQFARENVAPKPATPYTAPPPVAAQPAQPARSAPANPALGSNPTAVSNQPNLTNVIKGSTSSLHAPSSSQIVVTDGGAEAPAMRAKLIIQRGGKIGKEFPLTNDESMIGRWDADGGIFPDVDLDQDDPEAKVSRRHARIQFLNNQFLIEDLGSTNGTFINRGPRLLPGNKQPLKNGDEIIVGKTFLKFVVN